ncbi:MAG: helix-turn-helix transcriptional regulator [Burkholderiales bacterium]|nr:helix-turn-helix transcriptional regulator [Burkholderiales bacterium]
MHKSPALPFSLASAGEWSAPKSKDFPAHKHTYWEIVYYRSGKIRVMIANESYDILPGMVLITPPETIHAEIARTAYANFYIGIDAPPGVAWPRVCFDNGEREFEKVCGAIVNEWRASRPQRDTMLSLMLNQLTILIQRTADHVSSAEALVRKTEQIIAQRFTVRPTIAEIAREAGASVSSLRAHFARLRKRSPLDYMHAVRLRHALTLLRTSNLTLDAVADLCGYHSASHLSRHVKHATSISPGAFRSTSQ